MIIKTIFTLMFITASCMTECMYQRNHNENTIDEEFTNHEQQEQKESVKAGLLNNQLRNFFIQQNQQQPSNTSTILIPMSLKHFINDSTIPAHKKTTFIKEHLIDLLLEKALTSKL